MADATHRAEIRGMGLVCYGESETDAEKRMGEMVAFLVDTLMTIENGGGRAVVARFRRAGIEVSVEPVEGDHDEEV